MMFKNVAASFMVFAFDSTTNLPKVSDAANITAYVSKDYGAVTVLADTSATEMDATNAKGYYLFAAAQGETNADCLMVSAKSATSNIVVVGAPAIIYTRPTTGWLAPTVIARTLDVSVGGEAGVDWANVGSPATTLALTGTTIAVTQKVDVDTIKTNPVVNAGTITFPTTATLASTTNITAGTIATTTNLTNAPTNGDFTATMKTSIGTAVAASAVASVTGNVGGNVVGSVGSVVGAVGSVTGAVGSVTGNVGGNVTGSVGSVVGAVGSVTGAVGSVTGSVGSVVGLTASNLDATVSSRLASASYTAPPTAADNFTAIATTQLTESIRVNGTSPTLAQALCETLGHLAESSIAGVTKTTKKFDHSTTATTLTLDSATEPTSITRTT